MFDAARKGDERSVALLTQALGRGLPANLTNDKGDSLIMLSSYHGHAPLVRLLLQHGADPNRLNDRGQSPLAGVVFKNERECIEVLLEGGADPEVGEPSAIEACGVFGMGELEGVFRGQVEKLRGRGNGGRKEGRNEEGGEGEINGVS